MHSTLHLLERDHGMNDPIEHERKLLD
jgi:hypothetical protein